MFKDEYLPFDLEQIYTEQAVIERDMAQGDAYGSPGRPDWQHLSTVPCRLWWDKSAGVRSANAEYVTPARDVPVQRGGILVPAGTDITEQDRITAIQDRSGNPLISGEIKVVAVLDQGSYLELNVSRAHLGG